MIGKNALILPRVKSIGTSAVIGAGPVVTQDVPPNTYVGENPARNLTRLTTFGEEIANIKGF